MSVNRTVENGRAFPATVRNEIKAWQKKENFGLCNCCKEEIAKEIDHIVPIEWCENDNGQTFFDIFGINEMSEIGNAQMLCPRCHAEKSWAEQGLSTIQEKVAHALKWYNKVFTKSGQRRKTNRKTLEKRIKLIRRIQKTGMKRNMAKTDEQKSHFAKLRAKQRREKKVGTKRRVILTG